MRGCVIIRVIFFLVLMPLLMVACLPKAEPIAVESPSSEPHIQQDTPMGVQPTSVPPIAGFPAGQSGGSLTVAAQGDIPHRDVHQEFQETLTSLGPGLAYSRLLRLHTGPLVQQPSLLLECDLCEDWKLTNDFAYEFQLRPGIRWQEIEPVNGRDLVAGDLVYSYQRMQTPGWPNANLFSDRGISGFEALDDQTLRVNLAFLDGDALLALADGHSKVVAHEVVEQYGDLKDSPVVGTGAWIWEETSQGVGTSLSANPTYFEEGLPFLDQLEIKVVRSTRVDDSYAKEQLAAFQAGQVDVLTLPPPEWRRLYQSSTEFNSQVSQETGRGVTLIMNVRSKPLDDVAIRRAVLQAIDPWEYIDLIWAGQGSAGIGMPVQDPGWLLSLEEMRGNYLATPSRARDLLAETQRELPIDIELSVAEFDDIYLELGEQIAEDLRAVGFNPRVRPLNPSHYNEVLLGEGKEYQLVLGALPPTSTPNGFLLGLLHSGGPGNIAGHQDSILDALIEQQASELDPAERHILIAKIQRRVLEQGYLFSPVMASSQWVFDWDLKGFYPNTALSEYNYWSRVWLER